MSTSPERRFATSPEHEMLKRVFKKTSPKTAGRKTSLQEYRAKQRQHQAEHRMARIEDHLDTMDAQLNKTRERVDSISKKLDFIIQQLCTDTRTAIFNMDDI